MRNNKLVKKIKEPTSLSYINREKGFQLNAQSVDDIRGHISPLLKYRGLVDLKNNTTVKIYANDEFWEKKDYLTKL